MGARDRHEGQEDAGDGERVRRYRREIARVPGRAQRFQSREDLQRFWAECDAREGSGVEPDWKSISAQSKSRVSRVCPTYDHRPCLAAAAAQRS